jgi:hypothetical protein
MKKLLLVILFVFSIVVVWAANYPKEVEAALRKAGTNRLALVKVIEHFKGKGDPLKLKAVYFLLSNMDAHYSVNYYWADAKGNKVPFDELAYPDFNQAVKAFEKLKVKTPQIHAVQSRYSDLESIKSDVMISDIEKAFQTWKVFNVQNVSFDDFCEYILPYRITQEPLQNWRTAYSERFKEIGKKMKGRSLDIALTAMLHDQKKWFTNTWNVESSKEPLPRLGAMQLLTRKKGDCDDIANLQVFELRSLGYPVTIDFVPYWATTTGQHFFNVLFDAKGRPFPFDASSAALKIDNLAREPSKVIRITYSKQKSALVNFFSKESIPPGFMQGFNYKDVTPQYWPTKNLSASLYDDYRSKKVAYACVLNGLTWKPAWWGRVTNSKVLFTQMGKGAVYMPAIYEKKHLIPAGYPVALGYQHELVLKPDLEHKHAVLLKEQDKYLVFKPGKHYTLFFWDRKWIRIQTQLASTVTRQLLFANVPKNALLLLLPESSQNKDRPFIINEIDQRIWF